VNCYKPVLKSMFVETPMLDTFYETKEGINSQMIAME
jgi:hypothetical protein